MEFMNYDELPVQVQQALKTTSTVRKISMFIGWVLTGGILIFGFVTDIMDIGIKAFANIPPLLLVSLIFGGFIHGIVHMMKGVLKRTGNSFKLIPVPPVCFFIPLFVFFFGLVGCYFGGGIFLILDTIKFLRKKPLIYKSDYKRFLGM